MNNLIIAIDGHAGCGKSSTAKYLAAKLEYIYIDSGAMYRAVTLFFIRNQVNPDSKVAINEALKNIAIRFKSVGEKGKHAIFLNEENVSKDIRSMQVSNRVSDISAIPEVRHFLVNAQQQLGRNGGIVMDGRDIGTVVFPNADIKIYMTADVRERARRRQEEMKVSGQIVDLEAIVENLTNRDYMDSNRKESPLRKAEDAVVIDTTHLSFEEQTKQILELVKAKQKVLSI